MRPRSIQDKLGTPKQPNPAFPFPDKLSFSDAVTQAQLLAKQGMYAGAASILDLHTKRVRRDARVAFIYANILGKLNRFPAALDFAEESARLAPSPEKDLLIASVHRSMGASDAGISICDSILNKSPQESLRLRAMLLKGELLEEAGRFKEATAIVRVLLEGSDSSDVVHLASQILSAKLSVQNKEYDDAVQSIDALLDQDLHDGVRSQLDYLKAKALDRSSRYMEAFEAARSGNSFQKLEFDPDVYRQQVDVLLRNWSRETMEGFPRSACNDELPVFIAGMPRSGTSLIDQIIDAHAEASGVGELNEIEQFSHRLESTYDSQKKHGDRFGEHNSARFTQVAARYITHCQSLSPRGVKRVVNKALGNNKLVGLLALLFPRTRVIHVIRDPRDVAISCFMGGFNNRLHPWTTQLDWASVAWDQSFRMMQHWKDILDIPILDVHYELLIEDPEPQFRRIIDFLGLEWDDACLDFHKSKRTVRTLSYDQVNRPLYSSSKGRHRNYLEQVSKVQFTEYNPQY